MKRNKIVLFNPRTSPKELNNGDLKSIPLGLLAISSLLDKEGHDIKIIDAKIEPNYKNKILEYIEDAICLGITSMTGYQIHEGLEVSKAVKEKHPKIPVVWGGFHPSILPEQTVDNPYIDVVVRGQGEITFKELVYAFENNRGLNDILGITFKDDNGNIIQNPDRAFEDITKFPRLPYHLIDLEKYITNYEPVNTRTINLYTSHGCPYHCGFCLDMLIYKRRWSGRSSKRVLEELEYLVKVYKINGFVINDDNFFVNKRRVKEICEGIISKGLNIKWGWAFGRANDLLKYDDGLWKLLKESGMCSILVGAESGSQDILDFIVKNATVEDTIEPWQKISPLGIRVFFSLMFGFPKGYNSDAIEKSVDEEFIQTLDLIYKLLKINKNAFIMLFPFIPYPGTPLIEVCKKHGFNEPKTLEIWSQYSLDAIRAPFVPDKYVKIVNQLNAFIFPYISGTYRYYIGNKNRPLIIRKMFETVHKIFRITAKFRWRYRFFSFPIECELMKIWSNR